MQMKNACSLYILNLQNEMKCMRIMNVQCYSKVKKVVKSQPKVIVGFQYATEMDRKYIVKDTQLKFPIKVTIGVCF